MIPHVPLRAGLVGQHSGSLSPWLPWSLLSLAAPEDNSLGKLWFEHLSQAIPAVVSSELTA